MPFLKPSATEAPILWKVTDQLAYRCAAVYPRIGKLGLAAFVDVAGIFQDQDCYGPQKTWVRYR